MKAILPGATLGMLGSGQLGRMFAMAARRLGYRVHVFSPDRDTPTAHIADREFIAAYEDLDAVREFARTVEVVTLEFENIPAATVEALEAIVPVRPGARALHTTQHRQREKQFLRKHGFPVTEVFEVVDALPTSFPFPAILKTAGFGYDGKGQIKVQSLEELPAAWQALDRQPCVLEAFVKFEREVSMVGARGLDGSFVNYRLLQNTHANHILDVTSTIDVMLDSTRRASEEITRQIFKELDIVGTACVEFFLKDNGDLIVNEIAPRPHNSGHLTIEAAFTSQFEQQLRAVCGLPLGNAKLHSHAAMANLLGDLWFPNTPNWRRVLEHPDAVVHLYGKEQARPGRKMGHITALDDSPAGAEQVVRAARASMQRAMTA
jgi:5-(carboxyamino)imidazole ribonucleotide synthase